MQRYQSIDTLAPGGTQSFRRGDINMDKGKRMMSIRLKTTFTLNNATGSSTTLSDAEKQALLKMVSYRLAFGRDEGEVPYDAVDGQVMRDIARFCSGVELRGYSDTSTGLGKSIANGAGQTVVCDVVIPTGLLWFLDARAQRLFGLGRSQVKDMALRLDCSSSVTVKTNVTLTNVASVLLADVKPAKGDVFGVMPKYRNFSAPMEESAIGTEGLPLLVLERSAVHASSLLTAFSLKIGGEWIHKNVSAQDSIVDYSQATILPAAGILTDRATVLYQLTPDQGGQLADAPTGQVTFKQDTKTITSPSLSMLWLEPRSSSEIAARIGAAVENRGKELKAIGLAEARGVDLPARIAPVVGFVAADRDDREFDELPGLALAPSESTPRLDVPAPLAARAAAASKAADAAGHRLAAESLPRRIAQAVPGGVPGVRGFGAGASPMLERVRAKVS